MLKRTYINKERQDTLKKSGAVTFDLIPESLKRCYRVKCGVCNAFLKYNNIKQHMRKIHNDHTNDNVLWPVISEKNSLCVICGAHGGVELELQLKSLRGKLESQLKSLRELGKSNKVLCKLSGKRIPKGKHAHEKCMRWLDSELIKICNTAI